MSKKTKFGSSTTAEEVVKDLDLSHMVAIVTGGSSGIGLETCRVLALKGATVVVASRRKNQVDQAVKSIKESTKSKKVIGLQLDLGDFDSIDKFVKQIKGLDAFSKGFNLLINNAGVMACPYRLTKQGFESQIGINHFGHFKLTMMLLPLLALSGKHARIVNLSSVAHTMGTKVINFDDIFYKKDKSKYGSWYAYGQSKLANVVFTKALNKKLQDSGHDIIANSLHPGGIMTGLQKDMYAITRFLMSTIGFLFFKSIAQGASTTMVAAVHPSVKTGGHYFDDCQIGTPIPYTDNKEAQKKLWEISEKLCGVKFPLTKKK